MQQAQMTYVWACLLVERSNRYFLELGNARPATAFP
jgi:hypothetical protein